MRDSNSPRGATLLPSERPALTKTEALRQAIAALGYRAPVTEILAYVRDHFGIGALAPVVAAAPAISPTGAERAKRAAPKRGKSSDRADPSE